MIFIFERIFEHTYSLNTTGTESEVVRVDSGILEGSEISVHYDPMISKLVTWGKTRDESIKTMAKALDSYVIRGVRNNIAFCRALCTHPKYLAGDISTDFIKDFYPEGYVPDKLSQKQRRLIASAALSMYVNMDEADNQVSFENDFLWNVDGDEQTFVVGVGSPDSQVLLHDKESVTLERSHVQRFSFEDQDELTFQDQDWTGPHDALFKAVTEGDEEVVMEFVQQLPQGVRVQVSGVFFCVCFLYESNNSNNSNNIQVRNTTSRLSHHVKPS